MSRQSSDKFKNKIRALNYLTGLNYLAIAVVLALSVSLLFYWYVTVANPGYLTFNAAAPSLPTNSSSAASSFSEDFLAAFVTVIVSLISLVVLVLLPCIIGSFGNSVSRALLRLFKVKISWISLFVVKAVFVVLAFVLLAVSVMICNLSLGWPLLIFGAFFTLFSTLLLCLEIIFIPEHLKAHSDLW